jgi:hypothetical protein
MQNCPYQYEAARKPSEDSVSVDAPANKKFLSLSVELYIP